jgi:Holliday junction resolvasome RuvABC DNA-binding subunit
MKDFERALEELSALREVAYLARPGERDSPGAESIIVDSSPGRSGLTDLLEALLSLGYSREESRRRVARASATLGESASEEEILAEALRRVPASPALSR